MGLHGQSIVRLNPQLGTPLRYAFTHSHIRHFPGTCRPYIQKPKKDHLRQNLTGNAAVAFVANHQRALALVLKGPESAT